MSYFLDLFAISRYISVLRPYIANKYQFKIR